MYFRHECVGVLDEFFKRLCTTQCVGDFCAGVRPSRHLGSIVGLMLESSPMDSISEKVKNNLIWPCWMRCEFQLLEKLPWAYSWPFRKYHLREKLHSGLEKWKVLWVYLVLHWLAKRFRAKMDGMLVVESQLEIQLLLSWMKGLSFLRTFLFISIKTSKLKNAKFWWKRSITWKRWFIFHFFPSIWQWSCLSNPWFWRIWSWMWFQCCRDSVWGYLPMAKFCSACSRRDYEWW